MLHPLPTPTPNGVPPNRTGRQPLPSNRFSSRKATGAWRRGQAALQLPQGPVAWGEQPPGLCPPCCCCCCSLFKGNSASSSRQDQTQDSQREEQALQTHQTGHEQGAARSVRAPSVQRQHHDQDREEGGRPEATNLVAIGAGTGGAAERALRPLTAPGCFPQPWSVRKVTRPSWASRGIGRSARPLPGTHASHPCIHLCTGTELLGSKHVSSPPFMQCPERGTVSYKCPRACG